MGCLLFSKWWPISALLTTLKAACLQLNLFFTPSFFATLVSFFSVLSAVGARSVSLVSVVLFVCFHRVPSAVVQLPPGPLLRRATPAPQTRHTSTSNRTRIICFVETGRPGRVTSVMVLVDELGDLEPWGRVPNEAEWMSFYFYAVEFFLLDPPEDVCGDGVLGSCGGPPTTEGRADSGWRGEGCRWTSSHNILVGRDTSRPELLTV